MSRLWLPALLSIALCAASASHAACSGATVEEEFRQADVVVRARLVSEETAWNDAPSARYRARWGPAPAVRYELRVLDTFKGQAGPRIAFFQERNSGAFYLDPDRDYLLHLTRIAVYSGRPAAAVGAYHVRYACGQSKPWDEVRPEDLRSLRRLSGGADWYHSVLSPMRAAAVRSASSQLAARRHSSGVM